MAKRNLILEELNKALGIPFPAEPPMVERGEWKPTPMSKEQKQLFETGTIPWSKEDNEAALKNFKIK